MMLANRSHSRALVPALPTLSIGTVNFDRASSPALALALVFSLALAALTATRLIRVERDYQPALQDVRQLSATLEATRTMLRDSRDRKSTRLNSSHERLSRMPSSA